MSQDVLLFTEDIQKARPEIVGLKGRITQQFTDTVPSPSPPPPPPQGLQPGQPMGDHGQIFFTNEAAAKIAESGAGWVRLNFRLGPNFQDWTETDTFGFSALSRYETIVDNALNNNLKILGLLSNEAWNASVSPPSDAWQENNAEVLGGNGDNAYIQEFETNAARVLIPHFDGKIDHWEVWNEPNAGLTLLYPSNFAWLLRRVYLAAQDTDPTLAVVSGGLLSTHAQGKREQRLTDEKVGANYLRDTYSQGRNNAFWEDIKTKHGSYPLDAIGQHLYIDQWGSTSANRIEKAVKLVYDAYVDEEGGNTTKTTRVTEFGWNTSWGVNEATQAENLTTAYQTLKSLSYTPRNYWFFIQDIPVADLYHGLLRADGTAKPSWFAYQAAASSNDAPIVSIISPADGDTFESGATILFEGSASDTEDGVLTASLVWTSNLDGQIGTGGSFSTTLGDGDHTITASVTDSGGKTGSASISITAGSPPAGVTVTSIVPETMQQGTMIGVTITGSGFAAGANVTFENGAGPTPTASNVVWVDSNTITATVTARSGGPPRNRVWDVRVTNQDGSTGILPGGFTVIP